MASGLTYEQGHEARAAAARYTHVAMLLHWLIALFIVFNLALGYFMEGFPQPLRGLVISLHISGGLSVLALTAVRVFWRLAHKPPPELPGMKSWEHYLAHVVHLLLYVGMVLMPLTGWAIVSSHPPAGSPGWAAAKAANVPHLPPPPSPAQLQGTVPGEGVPGMQKLWWAIPVPLLRPIERIGITPGGIKPQDELHEDFVDWHGLGGYIMITLLLLHVAGALKHQWIDKQAELARMGIGRSDPLPAE